MTKRYMAVSVPLEMVQIINEKIKGRGYTSRAEFVKESVRMGLERIERLGEIKNCHQ